MFNGHTMSVVTDLNMIGPSINDTQYLYVAAITTSDYPRLPTILNAAVLMPPTEILMQWADGNDAILYNEYSKYLAFNKDADDMIVALLAAMTKRNIVIYIPLDEFKIYGMLLLNHLAYMYGITCNFMNTVFSVDVTKLPFIMAKFYMMDVMSYEDFIASYPPNALLPEFVIHKMSMEYPIPGATFMNYVQHFNQINASKASTKPPMVNMVEVIK